MKWLPALFISCSLSAQDLPRLEWDAVPESSEWGATNYTVYIGGESRAYTNTYFTGTNTYWNLPRMKPGVTNFFAVTATYTNSFDESGQESEYSEEVWYVPNWLSTPFIVIAGNTATWTNVPKATNYVCVVYSSINGTNTAFNTTNTAMALPAMTNGAWRVQVKAENHHTESKWGFRQIVNVPLHVPAGKFYVEKSATLSGWGLVGIYTGPTTLWFPADQTIGFFLYRPYFVSAASTKGATQLMASKKPVFKAKVKVVPKTNAVPQMIGPINLMPPK